MLERLRRRAADQKGFSLIELLVVVIIIGLLAAIAIPAFLGQRDKANDAASKSLVRNAAGTMETAYADAGAYTATPATLMAIEPNITFQAGAALTANDQVQVTAPAAGGYVLASTSKSGVTFTYTKAATGGVSRTCSSSATCTW